MSIGGPRVGATTRRAAWCAGIDSVAGFTHNPAPLMQPLTAHLERASRTIMLAAPLAPLALGVVGGIILDEVGRPGALIYFVGFAAAGAPLLRRGARRTAGPVFLALAAAGLGGMLHFRARTPSPSSIERNVGPDRRIARIRGVVAGEPRVFEPPQTEFARWTFGSTRTVFLLDADAIEGEAGDIPVTGRLRVTAGLPILDLRVGEPVEVFGWLYPFAAPMNPGSFDWAAFNRRSGIIAGLYCDQRENVRRLAPSADPPAGWLARSRLALRNLLTSDLTTSSEAEASLLSAMVLGHRSQLDRRINDIFVRAGCAHFIAVSGVHIVIVMGFARLLCSLVRAGPRTTTWALIAAALFYLLAAEPRPSVLRATVIALIYCVARLMDRERAYLNWISATVVILAVIDPGMIFDLGYQLSTTAVLGVAYLSPALRGAAVELRRGFDTYVRRRPYAEEDRRLAASLAAPFGSRRRRWMRVWTFPARWTGAALAVALAAWLAGLPIVAVYFGQVYAWGALGSIAALPLVSMVMLTAFVKLGVSLISPTLGAAAGALLGRLDTVLIGVVERLSLLPGAATATPTPPWWVVLAYYLLFLSIVVRFRRTTDELPLVVSVPRTERAGASRRATMPVGVAFVALLAAVASWSWSTARTGRLTVTVLAVGAGSATVLELPDGQVFLFDAGTSGPFDVGGNTIVPFLRARGVRRLDRVHVSHANLDHYSAIPAVMESLGVGPIVVTEYFDRSAPSSPSRHLLDLLRDRGKPVEATPPAPHAWEAGGATFELLWPPGGLDESLSINDTSMVIRIDYAGRSILLTGDIENQAQAALLAGGRDLHADVLLLPHHGGVRPTTEDFLRAVDASVAIRSSDERLSETFNGIDRLVGEAALLNTADVGAVTIELTPGAGTITVSTFRGGASKIAVTERDER